MPQKTLNMNKFFGNSYSTFDVNSKFIDTNLQNSSITPSPSLQEIDQLLAPIKQEVDLVKNENKQQNNSIIKVVNSFDGLISASKDLKLSTESFVNLIETDVTKRKSIQKSEEGIFQKQLQKKRSKEKTPKELEKRQEESFAKLGIGLGVAGLAAAAGGLLSDTTGDEEPSPEPTGPSDSGATANAGEYNEMLNLISSVESVNGGYNAYNEGGAESGYKILGYSGPSNQGPLRKNLTDMTIAEIMQHQKDKNPPIHAAGRYQIIGDTLKSLMSGGYGPTGVNANDKFTPANQDKLAIALIKNRLKTPTANNFISEWRGLINVDKNRLQKAIDKLKQSRTNTQPRQTTQSSPATSTQSAAPTSTNTKQASSTTPTDNKMASASNVEGKNQMEMDTKEISLAQAGLNVTDNSNVNPSPVSPMAPMAISLEPTTPARQPSMIPMMMPQNTGTRIAGTASPIDYSSSFPTRDPNNTQSFIAINYRVLGDLLV